MTGLAIALIGYGEVGRILAEDLAPRAARLSAWDVRFASGALGPRDDADPGLLRRARRNAEAVAGATLVISAVTAGETRAAAAESAERLAPGTWFLDLNAAAPRTKTEAAAIINAAGGRYVEAAVMSPVPPKRLAAPILLGGPHADAFGKVGASLGFSGLSVFSRAYGAASAAKLGRSVMVKGVEALLTESLLAARHYGVEDAVLASLENLLPGADWPALARYMVSRTLAHGARRAEEMREAAAMVAEAGIAPLMSVAAAERQAWAGGLRPAPPTDALPALLDGLRAAAADGPRMEEARP